MYAYMSPYQRDEDFLRQYIDGVKALWGRHHHRKEGIDDELKYDPINSNFEMLTPELKSAIHAARQHMDALGLQYGPAIRFIISEKILYKGNYGIPAPNQIYSHLALAELEKNVEYVRERHVLPFKGKADPRFLACNYAGHPPQVAALDEIQADIRQALNRPRALARYFAAGYISEEEARIRLGDDVVDEAVTEHGPARYAVNGGEFALRVDRPSCMGYAYDPIAATCIKCPVRLECVDFSETVRASQIEVTGTDNPPAVRTRVGATQRKRRERRKSTPEFKAEVERTRVELEKLMGIKIPRKSDKPR
jgi:hypothetical protein